MYFSDVCRMEKDMDKKTYKFLLEQREMEVALNLENNYMDEAYKNFIEYRNLAKGYLEEGYIKQKKFDKTYKIKIERLEDIFEPEEDNDVTE